MKIGTESTTSKQREKICQREIEEKERKQKKQNQREIVIERERRKKLSHLINNMTIRNEKKK